MFRTHKAFRVGCVIIICYPRPFPLGSFLPRGYPRSHSYVSIWLAGIHILDWVIVLGLLLVLLSRMYRFR